MGGIHRKIGGEGDAAGRPEPVGPPPRRAEEAGRPSIANSINYAFPIGSRVRVSFHDRKVIPGKIRFER
jgi:hypothetical protein